jgi:hypothetical protein
MKPKRSSPPGKDQQRYYIMKRLDRNGSQHLQVETAIGLQQANSLQKQYEETLTDADRDAGIGYWIKPASEAVVAVGQHA